MSEPEIGQVRLTGDQNIGEMWFVVISRSGTVVAECAVLHATGWYAEHFPIGSMTVWRDDWLNRNTIVIM